MIQLKGLSDSSGNLNGVWIQIDDAHSQTILLSLQDIEIDDRLVNYIKVKHEKDLTSFREYYQL